MRQSLSKQMKKTKEKIEKLDILDAEALEGLLELSVNKSTATCLILIAKVINIVIQKQNEIIERLNNDQG